MSETQQKYIVVFKEGVTADQINQYAEDLKKNGGEVIQRFDTSFNGFSAKLSDQQLQSLQSFHSNDIEFIEPDGVVTTQ